MEITLSDIHGEEIIRLDSDFCPRVGEFVFVPPDGDEGIIEYKVLKVTHLVHRGLKADIVNLIECTVEEVVTE